MLACCLAAAGMRGSKTPAFRGRPYIARPTMSTLLQIAFLHAADLGGIPISQNGPPSGYAGIQAESIFLLAGGLDAARMRGSRSPAFSGRPCMQSMSLDDLRNGDRTSDMAGNSSCPSLPSRSRCMSDRYHPAPARYVRLLCASQPRDGVCCSRKSLSIRAVQLQDSLTYTKWLLNEDIVWLSASFICPKDAIEHLHSPSTSPRRRAGQLSAVWLA